MAWRTGRPSLAAMLLCTCAAIPAALAPSRVAAQQVFGTIQAFGDSYVDNGNALAILKKAAPAAYAQLAPIYPTGRFSGGTDFVDTISSLLAIPQANYAIGGAETGTNNTIAGLPGFQQEWQAFVGAGNKIASSDLVVLNIGGNDARTYYQGGGTLAGVPAAATVAATQAIAGVNALVGAGARTLVFTAGNVGALPETAAYPSSAVAVGSAYSQAYNQQTEAALGQIAAGGVRVEYVDIGLIGQEVVANPSRYGITFTGACPLSCVGNPALQSQYLYYVDGIHLTSAGFAILGEYVVNRLEAPATLPAQGNVGATTEMAFAQTLLSRMDMFAGASAVAPVQRELADLPEHPVPAAPLNPWSVYMLADGETGDGTRTTAGAGYSFTSIGGTVGAEYRAIPNTLIGFAFNYENPQLKLDAGRGTTTADSFQFGLYGTYASTDFFAQGLALGGYQNYRNSRPGVVDVISSSTNGSTFVTGGKVGKLYDTSFARIGPIVGLLYGRADLDPYAEAGDPALVLNVGRQVQETVVASGGVQLRFPFAYLAHDLEPYVNLTVESNVVGDGRLIQYGATSAPLIVNTLAVPGADSRRPYGRVGGGLSAPIGPSIALTAFATTTIDRPGGNDFSGSGGLKFAF